MNVWVFGVGSVVLVSLVSLVGILSVKLTQERVRSTTRYLVSFAAGALFGDAFLHLLPDIYSRPRSVLTASMFVLSGIVAFFVLENFFMWRHCHDPGSGEPRRALVTMNLAGDALHNAIDGLIIGASYAASIPLGITSSLAILLHEVPQELGDFGVLVHGGLSPRRALLYNLGISLTAVVGTVLALAIGTRASGLVDVLLPIAAGGFVYIAGSDLIPELKTRALPSRAAAELALMLLGIGVMLLLTLLE